MASVQEITVEARATYACDRCHSRKVSCSRERAGCRRCKFEAVDCIYSRLGVIRRTRKPKVERRQPSRPSESPADTEHSRLQRPSQLALGVAGDTAHERLRRLTGRDHPSLKSIALLLEKQANVWQDTSTFDKLAEGAAANFYTFDKDQVHVWVGALTVVLKEEMLLFTSAPPDVLRHLAASRLHQIEDRAWLVMFYSAALSFVSLNPGPESIKAKLRSNLWLAFNDVRLLLEPKATSIQALVIMACRMEEFMTPSLCWSLISRACIMLQTLGVTSWHLDLPTRERRTIVFWRLYTMDQALALVLKRAPTFHRHVVAGIPLPELNQLLASPSHHPSGGMPVWFDAHYRYQVNLLSRIMDDTWSCVYGQKNEDGHRLKDNLESWYQQATEVLQAAALTEKPVLTPAGTASTELGLLELRFRYYSVFVLLMVSVKELRPHCIEPSRQMLRLLPSLGSMMMPGSKEPYACLVWQYLRCPMVAFGTLWGEILVKGVTDPELRKQYLAELEQYPAFLGKFSSRNPLAAKLQNITSMLVQEVRTALASRDEQDDQGAESSIQVHTTPTLRDPVEGDVGEPASQPVQTLPRNTAMPFTCLDSDNRLDSQVVEQEDENRFLDENKFLDDTFSQWFLWYDGEDTSPGDR